MASNNDRRIYYDLNSGQKYVLFEESITSGGEGSIYNIEGMPDLVAKIYHEKNRTENRKNKLLAMLETDSNDLSECAWPHAILYQDNNFCGYVMQKVSGSISISIMCIFPITEQMNSLWFCFLRKRMPACRST